MENKCDGNKYADKATLDMSANRWKYFRWTPRTAWITFVYVALVPSAVGYLGFMTEVSGLCEGSAGCGGWGRGEREGRGRWQWGRERNGVDGMHCYGRLADVICVYQGKYQFRGKRRGDIIQEF